MVISPKYILLPLEQRTACSHAILFKSANRQEIDRIREEIMFDLEFSQQDALLKEAWKEPYSFLFIAIDAPRDWKYSKCPKVRNQDCKEFGPVTDSFL